MPAVSNINYVAGQTRANATVSLNRNTERPLSSASLWPHGPSVIDVNGYWVAIGRSRLWIRGWGTHVPFVRTRVRRILSIIRSRWRLDHVSTPRVLLALVALSSLGGRRPMPLSPRFSIAKVFFGNPEIAAAQIS